MGAWKLGSWRGRQTGAVVGERVAEEGIRGGRRGWTTSSCEDVETGGGRMEGWFRPDLHVITGG